MNRRGQQQQKHHGDGDLHHLPDGPLQGDGPRAAAEITGVAPMRNRAVDVPDHATGQRRVQEL
jgi:hypothetical protein